jgi:Berberine and berberine like
MSDSHSVSRVVSLERKRFLDSGTRLLEYPDRTEITMEPTLHIRLLGNFSLTYADQQVTSLNSMRLQSLLAYLVLHSAIPQQRQHLAFLFWPDTTEAQARNNLRQLLHQLRQAFPMVESFLSADKHTLHWHSATPCNLDVAEFEQALTLADMAVRRDDQHIHQTKASDTAFSFRDANFVEVIAGVDPDPANNEHMIQWARDYWMALHPYSAGGSYVNMMMDEGTASVQAAYRDNYTRLAQSKATYDPSNLLQVNQNIKPPR